MIDDAPVMRDVAPPDFIRVDRHGMTRAGLSCGRVGPEHSREVLLAPVRRIGDLCRAWRCTCGAPALGEDRRPDRIDRDMRREGRR